MALRVATACACRLPNGVGVRGAFTEGPQIPYMFPYAALCAQMWPHVATFCHHMLTHVAICCHIVPYVATFCHEQTSWGIAALLW